MQNQVENNTPQTVFTFDTATLTGLMMAYEEGAMSAARCLQLFSHLIRTGLCWSLQGHYGRTAHHLIEIDIINRSTGEIDWGEAYDYFGDDLYYVEER